MDGAELVSRENFHVGIIGVIRSHCVVRVSLVVACSLASLSSFRLAAGKTRTLFEVMRRSSYAGMVRDDDSNHLVAPQVLAAIAVSFAKSSFEKRKGPTTGQEPLIVGLYFDLPIC